MRIVLIIGMFLLVAGCDTARNTEDPQEKYFLRYYGLAGYQEAVDMVETNDGNFLLLGNSRVSPDAPSQVYLVKVNQFGYVLNQIILPSTTSQVAKDIEPTTSGEFLLLIDSITNNGTSDILVKRIDDLGSVSADSTFSFKGNYNEFGNTITQLFDASGSPDGFIITGYTDAVYDSINQKSFAGKTALKVRFNQDLTSFRGPWNHYDGAAGDDISLRIVQRGNLTDEDRPPFVLFGYTNSDAENPSFNYWITPVDLKGEGPGSGINILANSPTEEEKLTGIKSVNSLNEKFVLSGTSTDASGDDHIFIAGVNVGKYGHTLDGALGSLSLDINLGKLQSIDASFQNVSVTTLKRTGYLIAANQIAVDDTDIILAKLSVNGAPVWAEPVRFGGSGNDRQSALMELEDGRLLLLGTMELGNDRQSKMVLMKLNSQGQLRD